MSDDKKEPTKTNGMRFETQPETAKEALALWDEGHGVWTVEMGGLGPGYEQAIQIVAFELVRRLVDKELPEDKDKLQAMFDEATQEVNLWHDLGLSGAQAGSAAQIAYKFLKNGYRKSLQTAPADRMIQVSKQWPSAEPIKKEAAAV